MAGNVARLAIDEAGFEQLGRAEASLLSRLVSHRYGRGSILITTNKGNMDWVEMLAGDEVLATARRHSRVEHKHASPLMATNPNLKGSAVDSVIEGALSVLDGA